jgi:hypothetical protein
MLRTPYVAAVLPGGERGDGVSDEVAEEGERESENPTESPTDDPELVGIP